MRTLPFLVLVACGGASKSTPSSDSGGEETPTVPAGDCADRDEDGDGHNECDDCNDSVASIHPGADEICDGEDSDCDGSAHPAETDANGDGALDCQACEEEGWFVATQGVSGDDVHEQVAAWNDFRGCDYDSARDEFFFDLDNVDTQVECVYTGRLVTVVGRRPDGNDMNTEHTWPQSWGAESGSGNCDLHHLYPTDSVANSTRASLPFGEVDHDITYSQGGSELGLNADNEQVFEPRDSHKGNVARSMLYMWATYGSGGTYAAHEPTPAEVALYQAWNRADPVDEAELARTRGAESYQGNLNPYVVCSHLIDQL